MSRKVVVALLLLLFTVRSGGAETLSREDFGKWLDAHRDATPDFAAGDELAALDRNRLVPFVPPGYLEHLDFPEFRAKVSERVDHGGADAYRTCTEKHSAQVRLDESGALQHYVCGQPFLNVRLTTEAPAVSGLMAAWNFEHRWQNYGPAAANVLWIWKVFDGRPYSAPVPEPPPTHMRVIDFSPPADTSGFFGGGGSVRRVLQGTYRRAYYSHLSTREAEKGVLPIRNAGDFHFKDYVAFHDPFDLRGAAFIIHRYADPLRQDDAWGYIPTLRQVRRLSVVERTDAVFGTEHTLDDFYSFSGRPLDWEWRFLGWKDLLAVTDSRWDYTHYYGPNGMVPNDVWSLRTYAVVERIPRNPAHPYGSVVMFWDRENYAPSYSMAWDRGGRLWKIWQWQNRWSEDVEAPELKAINVGTRVSIGQSVQVFDEQNRRGTIIAAYGYGSPAVDDVKEVEHLFDVSRLEEMHR